MNEQHEEHKPKRIECWFNRVVNACLCLFGFVVLVILFRMFVIDVFYVPSDSMEHTLHAGDVIVVNKLVYGTKLPCSPFEIPLVSSFYALSEKANKRKNHVWWQHRRLAGFGEPEHGDVMVFRHPYSRRRDFFLVKRCVALPGDTVELRNATLYVNGDVVEEYAGVSKMYKAKVSTAVQLDSILEDVGVEDYRRAPDDRHAWRFRLNWEQYERLRLDSSLDSLRILPIANDSANYCYRKGRDYPWTINDFGPLVLPRKGEQIEMNSETHALYIDLIWQLERNRVKKREGGFFLEDLPIQTYTFKYDYFFALGDNRSFSLDSRYLGAIPDCEIVGKVVGRRKQGNHEENYGLYEYED